jgi:hypothetical protein
MELQFKIRLFYVILILSHVNSESKLIARIVRRPNQSENSIPDTNVFLAKDLNILGLHDYSTKKRLFCSKKALGLPRTFSRHIRHAETLNSHSKTAKTPKCIRKSRIFFHLPTGK